MKTKKSVLLLLALVFVFAFTACGTSANQPVESSKVDSATEKAAEKVELSWYMNNQAEEGYLDFIKNFVIGKFQEKYPNITINLTLNNDPGQITSQMLAAGAGPDVVALDGPATLQQFVAANYLKPLDDYGKDFGWVERFDKAALDSCRKGGKIFGLPDAKECLLMYYNKKLFADNGWKIPATYAEFISLCEAIKAKDIVPISFGCSDLKGANEWWVGLAYNLSIGKEEFKKYLTGETPWNSPAIKEATAKLVDMWKKGYIYKNSASITLNDSQNMFATGKSAMHMEGTWAFPVFNAAASLDYGIFIPPTWNDNIETIVPVALSGAMGININCPHPDEAARFLDWYYGVEVGQEMLKQGSFWAISGIDVASAKDLDSKVAEAYNIIQDAMQKDNVGYLPWTYWPPNVETYAWSNIEAVYFGQMSVDEYVNNLQKEFEKDKANDNLYKFTD